MTLTQAQKDQCGEAINAALAAKTIDADMRGRLILARDDPPAGSNIDLRAALLIVIDGAWGGYVASLNAFLSILTGNAAPNPFPAPVQPTPVPIQPGLPPVGGVVVGPYGPVDVMTAPEIAAFLPALKTGINQRVSQAMYDRIAGELGAGTYSVCDIPIVTQVKDWYWNGGNKDAIRPYLAAVDQRSLSGADANLPLTFNDPRTVHFDGATPATPPAPTPPPAPAKGEAAHFPGDVRIDGVLTTGGQSAPVASNVSVNASAVVAALAELGIYVQQNRLGVGVRPDADSGAAITVGGESGAVIDGISNTKGTDGQNPGEVHKNSLVVADNDGGMRARQYVVWGPNGKARNTLNRPFTTFAFMDSMGDPCISDSRWPKGQVFYLVKSEGSVTLATYQQGWTLKLKESVAAYGATDKEIV